VSRSLAKPLSRMLLDAAGSLYRLRHRNFFAAWNACGAMLDEPGRRVTYALSYAQSYTHQTQDIVRN
jgi:hypothetical protein